MNKHTLRLLFWESTQRCNLSCAHCRMDETKHYTELTTDQAKHLIDSIADFASPIFIFSGGEPLMRDDLFELIDYADIKGIKVALASNGTLIDQSVVNNIKKSAVKRVSISLDGATKEYHDLFRNSEGSFDKALNAVQLLINSQVSTQINATITRNNVNQLEDIVQLSNSLKVDALHLFLVVPVGCGKSLAGSEMLQALEYESALEKIFQLSRQYVDHLHIKVTCAPQYYRILKQKAPQAFSKGHQGMHGISKGCLAGTGVCFVSAKGDVYPCGYLPVKAGNIFEASLKDIWHNSEVFNSLRDAEMLKGNCQSCCYEGVCGGCRARAYFSQQADYMAEDPNCILNQR